MLDFHMPYVPRPTLVQTLTDAFRITPVVGLIGPRQVGKTSIAREVRQRMTGPPVFDLERPADRARLADPELALKDLEGLVVIDEVQELPELLPVLRVLVDRSGQPARFLLTGSASPDLLRLGSESLAGRITWIETDGFDLAEIGDPNLLWIRGGLPRSTLAESDADAAAWRRAYLKSLLHRDLLALGIKIPSRAVERFLILVAHRHGQVLNRAELAKHMSVSQPTIRRWLDLLVGAFILRELKPYGANVEKRQVKSSRFYLRDTGLLHTLLDLETRHDVERHPVVGASWEGLVIREAIRAFGAREDQAWFWSTHSGPELDLLLTLGGRRVGIEVKRTTEPKITDSIRAASEVLNLDEIYLVHAGDLTFPLPGGVTALSAHDLSKPGGLP